MSTNKTYFGLLDEINENKFTIKTINGKSFGATYINNEYKVILNVCPHEGAEICKGVINSLIHSSEVGSFDLDSDKKVVVCPWHRWEFDLLTGKSLTNTGKKIAVFETLVEDNILYFNL